VRALGWPAMLPGMIRAIIFDLDNCLSAADEVGPQLMEPVFQAIREANHGHLSEAELDRAFADCWRIPLDVVAEQHGFSKEMLEAGWKVSLDLEVAEPMFGYGDLRVLRELPVLRFLVTSGFRRLQESKIRALGFRDLFTAVFVDAIDEPNRKGKHGWFAEILQRHALKPGEVLVVGDNPDSEIAAGNKLGAKTVQILRAGVPRGANATRYIRNLGDLQVLLQQSMAE
jgi:FMN phosphatase YigB (HAD superfamily)